MTDPQTTEQAPQSNDLSDLASIIENQFDSLDSGQEEEVLEEGASEDEAPEVEAEAEAEAETGEEEEAVEAEASDEDKPVTEDEEPNYDLPAPERWPKEMKEAYDALPPEMRKTMMENVYKPMQANYTKATQELAQQRNVLNPMLELLQQHRGAFEQAGINPVAALQRQMQWAAHFAAVGQEQGLRDYAKAVGIDLTKQQASEDSNSKEEYLTPVEREMKAFMEAQKQEREKLEQQQQLQRQQHVQQRVRETQEGLEAFINESENGLPAHPHVEKLAPQMAGLIRGGVVPRVDDTGNVRPVREVIDQAYRMAVNLNPSTRRAASKSGQVERAAAANRSVETTVPAGQVDVQAGPISDDISKLYDQLARRG